MKNRLFICIMLDQYLTPIAQIQFKSCAREIPSGNIPSIIYYSFACRAMFIFKFCHYFSVFFFLSNLVKYWFFLFIFLSFSVCFPIFLFFFRLEIFCFFSSNWQQPKICVCILCLIGLVFFAHSSSWMMNKHKTFCSDNDQRKDVSITIAWRLFQIIFSEAQQICCDCKCVILMFLSFTVFVPFFFFFWLIHSSSFFMHINNRNRIFIFSFVSNNNNNNNCFFPFCIIYLFIYFAFCGRSYSKLNVQFMGKKHFGKFQSLKYPKCKISNDNKKKWKKKYICNNDEWMV